MFGVWLILTDCQKFSWVPSVLSAVPNGNMLYEKGVCFNELQPCHHLKHQSLTGVGSGAAARTTGPEHGSYCCKTEVIARCNFHVPYSQAPQCSAPSLPVTQPLLLPIYFPQPPSTTGDVQALTCPEGSDFGQIQLGLVAVVASMKIATFLLQAAGTSSIEFISRLGLFLSWWLMFLFISD